MKKLQRLSRSLDGVDAVYCRAKPALSRATIQDGLFLVFFFLLFFWGGGGFSICNTFLLIESQCLAIEKHGICLSGSQEELEVGTSRIPKCAGMDADGSAVPSRGGPICQGGLRVRSVVVSSRARLLKMRVRLGGFPSSLRWRHLHTKVSKTIVSGGPRSWRLEWHDALRLEAWKPASRIHCQDGKTMYYGSTTVHAG